MLKEILINDIEYIKITSINSRFGQFDVFIKAEGSDKNIYFFERVDDGDLIYKEPEEHILEELRSNFDDGIMDIKPSNEDSKAARIFKERLENA